MADIPNESFCSLKPLDMFEQIAAQGEKVRSLKSKKASKVKQYFIS